MNPCLYGPPAVGPGTGVTRNGGPSVTCWARTAEGGFSLAAGAADQLGRTIPFFALRAALREPPGQLATGDSPDGLPDTPAWWIGRSRASQIERGEVAATEAA
jgi:hypothetical protein